MPSVEEHYTRLLAPHYSWICGGAEGQLEAHRAFFARHAVQPGNGGVALDLGAGPGFQSIPLAELGFRVIAIDLSGDLLDELRRIAGDLPITTRQDDLRHFSRHSPGQVELIVCMGDTLTHLNTLREVKTLINRIARALASGGRLFLAFRDMSKAAEDLDRFIAVRSDADRIFTCFLEFEKRHVKVHDLVYIRSADQWALKKSYFRKLRIAKDWLETQILKSGLNLEHGDTEKGMTTIIARKS